MRRIWLLMPLAVALLPAALTWGQEDQAKGDLVKAIESLAKKDVALTGSVAEEQPKADAGFPKVVFPSPLGGSSGVPYSGNVEVLCTQEGETIVVSKEKLPSIKVYRLDEKSLCIQAHTDDPFHVAGLMDHLTRLTSWEDLAQAVNGASRVRVNNQGSDTEVRVVLDSAYIPVKPVAIPGVGNAAAGGAAAGAAAGGNVRVQVQGGTQQPSVIDLTATFVLNSSKQITSMEFSLQYDDPMQAMISKAMKGGIGGIAMVRITGTPGPKKDAKDGDPVLGKLNKYSLKVLDTPSQAAQAFASEARDLLK